MKIKNQKVDAFDIINIIFLTLFSLIMLYPIWYILINSLSDNLAVAQGRVLIWFKGFNLQGYQKVLQDGRILGGYWNSIKQVVLQVIMTLTIGSLVAYPLSKKGFPLRKLFTILVIVPMIFQGGLIPTYMLIRSMNLYNTVWALILPVSFNAFYIMIMKTFFAGLPEEIEEAALIDGCGPVRYFFTFAIPMSKAVLAVIALYAAVARWNSYLDGIIYLKDQAKYPLQVILRNVIANSGAAAISGEGTKEMESIYVVRYAMIILGTLPILSIYPFILKYFEKGVTLGSVKG